MAKPIVSKEGKKSKKQKHVYRCFACGSKINRNEETESTTIQLLNVSAKLISSIEDIEKIEFYRYADRFSPLSSLWVSWGTILVKMINLKSDWYRILTNKDGDV